MGAVEHELEVVRRRGVGAFDTQHAAITGEVRQPHGTQHRRQALRKPLTAQTASDIYGPPVAIPVGHDGRHLVHAGPAFRLIGGQYRGRVGRGRDHVGEVMRHRAIVQVEVIQCARHVVAHRGELFDAHADDVTNRARVAAKPDVVVLVAQSGVVRHEQLAAVRHELPNPAARLFGQQIHARQHGNLVGIPIGPHRNHVGGDAVVGKRAEPIQRLGPMIDLLGRVRGVLGGPLGLVVEHDGDLGLDRLGAHQTLVGQTSQIGAQLAHITEDLRILARMRHHRGVPLLRAGLGLSPLEIADGVGAHGDLREGVAHDRARLRTVVDRTPIHRGGGMLHLEPRFLA